MLSQCKISWSCPPEYGSSLLSHCLPGEETVLTKPPSERSGQLLLPELSDCQMPPRVTQLSLSKAKQVGDVNLDPYSHRVEPTYARPCQGSWAVLIFPAHEARHSRLLAKTSGIKGSKPISAPRMQKNTPQLQRTFDETLCFYCCHLSKTQWKLFRGPLWALSKVKTVGIFLIKCGYLGKAYACNISNWEPQAGSSSFWTVCRAPASTQNNDKPRRNATITIQIEMVSLKTFSSFDLIFTFIYLSTVPTHMSCSHV